MLPRSNMHDAGKKKKKCPGTKLLYLHHNKTLDAVIMIWGGLQNTIHQWKEKM